MSRIANKAFVTKCVLALSVILGAGAAQSADVAHVLRVNGFALASSSGGPVPLDALDGIRDRTKVDVQANSELQLCHYVSRTLVTVKGPAIAMVSIDGLTAESGRAVQRSSEPCTAPQPASVQGGHLSRGPKPR